MSNTSPFGTNLNIYTPISTNGVYNANIRFISNTYSSSYTSIYSIDTTNNIMPEYVIYDKDDCLMTSVDGIKYSEFGSLDSLDVDVMFYLHYPLESIKWCKDKAAELKYKVDKKYVDVNFAVMNSDCRLSSCYKGSIDEVNNMLYYTTWLGFRNKGRFVKKLYPRSFLEKRQRVLRGILSYLSRTAHRKDIKKVLGKYDQSVDLFKNISIKEITELNKNNVTYQDFCKFMAFQFAQLDALNKDIEIFTKQDAVNRYPELYEFIYRKSENADLVEELQKRYIELFESSKIWSYSNDYLRQYALDDTTNDISLTSKNVFNNSWIYPNCITLPLKNISQSEYLKIIYADNTNVKTMKIIINNNGYISYFNLDSSILTLEEIIKIETIHINALNELRKGLK